MQCNGQNLIGVALAAIAACNLARPAGAGVLVDVSVSDKQNGKYSQQVSVKPGDKLFSRVSAMNTYGKPLVAVCDIPMLKYQGKDLLMPGQVVSMTLTAKCLQPGTFKPAACIEFVDPKTGSVSEVDDSCLVLCAKPGDEAPSDIGGGQQHGGTDKGGGYEQGDPQQGGGQQPALSEPAFSLLGSQQQSGGQQMGGGQQQGDSGDAASGQQGGPKDHGQDKKGKKGKKGGD